MDFGLTFIMRLRWQDPRMMFPDIEGEKMLDNKTILTMDLKFLEELWVPGTCWNNRHLTTRPPSGLTTRWRNKIRFTSEFKDVFFANEKSANVHQITSDNKRLRIDSAGFIYLEMRLSATLSCHMRFEHFPMDVQVCIHISANQIKYSILGVQYKHWIICIRHGRCQLQMVIASDWSCK